jgi:hypothetical protein
MKKNISLLSMALLMAVSLNAQTSAKESMTPEESVTSKVLGKVLSSIDYSKTTFNLNLFEGSLSTDDKLKSNIDIQNLNAQLDLRFKENVTFTAQEFIKNIPKDPRAQQWIPNINLVLKDYRIRSTVMTEPTMSKTDKVFNVKINFQKSTNSTETNNFLKIQVGNEFNQNLINLNLIAVNVNVSTVANAVDLVINGSCSVDKIVDQLKQHVDECSFKGTVNPNSGKYNIKVKFSDKKQNSLQ